MKSQKISNIYLKRSLSYNSFNLLWVESTPPPGTPNRVKVEEKVGALSSKFTQSSSKFSKQSSCLSSKRKSQVDLMVAREIKLIEQHKQSD